MGKNIDFKNLPPAVKIVLTFVPAIIIVAIFFYVTIKPKITEIETINKAIAKLDNEIKTNQVKVRRLAELKEKNRELQEKLVELMAMLPDEKEVSILLKQVSDLGVQSGLEILFWKPANKETGGNGLYLEIPVNVEMLGGYHNLGKFFSQLSTFERIVNVLDISIKPASKQSEDNKKDKIWRNQISFKAVTYSSVVEKKEGS
jgi:type IV pilus assembly protein PilO